MALFTFFPPGSCVLHYSWPALTSAVDLVKSARPHLRTEVLRTSFSSEKCDHQSKFWENSTKIAANHENKGVIITFIVIYLKNISRSWFTSLFVYWHSDYEVHEHVKLNQHAFQNLHVISQNLTSENENWKMCIGLLRSMSARWNQHIFILRSLADLTLHCHCRAPHRPKLLFW